MKTKIAIGMMVLAMALGAVPAAAKTASKTVSFEKGKNSTFNYDGNWDGQYTVYHKLTVSNPSTITVNGYPSFDKSTMTVALCGSDKKELEYRNTVGGDAETTVTWAVNKGTYYIKTSGWMRYNLMAKVTKVAAKGGATKKTAASFKSGKTAYGILPAGKDGSKSKWYKVTAGKDGLKMTLDVSCVGTTPIAVRIYGPSFPSGQTYAGSFLKKTETVYAFWDKNGTATKSEMKKGTYYVCITKTIGEKKRSAAFTVKVKFS